MDWVNSSDVELVTKRLEDYLQHVLKTQNLNLQEFFELMEPKFAAAGYRSPKMTTNLLIIHDVGAGDFILQSAAIREIRRIYPAAHITLIVNSSAFNLAECCPYVDEIIVEKINPWSGFLNIYRESIELARGLLLRRFDICFAFSHTLVAAVLMYVSGARTRITHKFETPQEAWGYNADIPLNYVLGLATHNFPIYSYGSHVVDAHLSLVDHLLQAPVANRDLEVWYNAWDFGFVRPLLKNATRPIYAFCMGGGGVLKHYPPEKYARVLKLILSENTAATFVLFGGGQNDLISVQSLKNAAPKIYSEHIIDLTGKVTFRQSAAALSMCDMYIGNDTGTMHIAAALKIPILALFACPEDLPATKNEGIRCFRPYKVPSVIVQPKHALPECAVNAPYYWQGCRITNKPHCITQIDPETVFNGFKLLKKQIAENASEPLYIS